MAKMKISGNAMVITSSIKADDMYLVNNKVRLTDKDGNTDYIFEYDPQAKEPTVSKYGAVFNKATRGGQLQMTVLVADNDVEAIKHTYADAIIALNEVETAVTDMLTARKELIEQTFADIEVDE